MRRDEIERTLKAMGTTPVAPPDDATVARIEARWRSAPGGGRRQWATLDPTVPSPHRRPLLLVAAGLAAAASVALAVIVATRDQTPDEVFVSTAEDIVIVLPSGEFIDPEPGKAVPEGAFVQAGPYAAGRIGDSDVRPDDLFVVRDGHLQPADIAQLTAAAPESSVSESSVSESSVSESSGTGSAGTSARSGSTVPATRRVTTTPPSTAPVTPASVATTAATTTAATTTAASSTVPATVDSTTAPASDTTDRPVAARLRVGAHVEDGSVVVTWKPFTGNGFRRYVVFRVRSWGGGRPGGGRLAAIGEASVASYIDAAPKAGTYYVVIAVGQGNETLALGGTKSPYVDTSEVVTGSTSPIIVAGPSTTIAASSGA